MHMAHQQLCKTRRVCPEEPTCILASAVQLAAKLADVAGQVHRRPAGSRGMLQVQARDAIAKHRDVRRQQGIGGDDDSGVCHVAVADARAAVGRRQSRGHGRCSRRRGGQGGQVQR